VFLFSFFLVSARSNTLINRVRDKINSIKPFKVQFINQVVNNSVVEIEETGEMFFLNKNRIKWVYQDPDYKVWIMYGNSYEYYDKEEEQITRGKFSKKTQLWIFKLLNSKEGKDDIMVDLKKMELHIVDSEDGVNFTILISNDYLPSKIIQKDPTGVDIIYIFSEYKKNIVLSDEDFKLKTEGKIDIIDLE